MLPATNVSMAGCLEMAQTDEAIFPPSRTLVRLAVVGWPASPVIYPEMHVTPVAGKTDPLDQIPQPEDYIALSVSGRY